MCIQKEQQPETGQALDKPESRRRNVLVAVPFLRDTIRQQSQLPRNLIQGPLGMFRSIDLEGDAF